MIKLRFIRRFKVSSVLGFTMIELLIVIAIIGILAVAVLSAINPVEQINRGRDTGSRSDAEQLLSAIDRYNTFFNYFPWQEGNNDAPSHAWTAWNSKDVVQQNNTGCNVSDLLSEGSTTPVACTGSGELKVTFFSNIFKQSYNTLYVYHNNNTSGSTYLCFSPKSDAFKTEAKTRVTAGVPSDYPADAIGNTDDCGSKGNCVCIP